MTTSDLDMTLQEHIETALVFLEQSRQELAAGDILQGCEKLWGAAAHATMAYAQHRGWPYGDHPSLKQTATRLSRATGDTSLRLQFGIAEKFHANYYHSFMQDYELENDPPEVHEFVKKMVSITQSPSKE